MFTDLCLDGVPDSPMVGRASEAMWIFSTALCAVVGVMVAIGVAYQIHLDKISKKKKLEYQRSKRGKPLRTSQNLIQLSAQVEDIWAVFRFLKINCLDAFLFPTNCLHLKLSMNHISDKPAKIQHTLEIRKKILNQRFVLKSLVKPFSRCM